MVRDEVRQAVSAARDMVQGAHRIAVLTGAGMSAESGIPTFRDAQTGLWARFDPMQLASPDGFRSNPNLVWDWYAERRAGVRAAHPNDGHCALAFYALIHPGRLQVITQNVDDLHQRAGLHDTLRLHGDILHNHWLEACPKRRSAAGACDPSSAEPGRPPRCAECGNLLRPSVVWFGERLPPAVLAQAELLVQRCDLMLVVGTSGTVYPAAGLVGMARDAGAKVIIVNPHPSDLDELADLCLRGTAATVLPLLLDIT